MGLSKNLLETPVEMYVFERSGAGSQGDFRAIAPRWHFALCCTSSYRTYLSELQIVPGRPVGPLTSGSNYVES